ncbi:hypothetical protein SD960_07790 [Flavobacterium sp. MMLR14_040]|uniref:hypothetical protein n=1 Tax=Flavobacterium sp. MMLR14_040 TaxID=3093843 RepID=UPI00299008C2|nr:hypothetical protein [Flavobacterium sp. MMLR14_040]MDW8849987.1 hypothetical protein [Flavobacterium sp. MMLR14_040]
MKETIKTNVKAYISSFANMQIKNIKDEQILKNHPLKLDDIKLGFLAITLRGYLKSIKPDETILATELREKNFDVKKTYELLIKKAGL